MTCAIDDWFRYDLGAEPSKSRTGIPRAPGGGTHRAGQAAFGNQALSPGDPKCCGWSRGQGRFPFRNFLDTKSQTSVSFYQILWSHGQRMKSASSRPA